ncbi:MAG: hypothetical protein H7263_13225, partial [Candidatus Sericytochromatia bacterium]|nr:hypothetical protein [Candidatus Sericytochromatia bacterium]
MLNVGLKKISKYTTGFVIACTLAGCGHLNSAIVPVVPTRQYTSPTFTPANNEFGATIP